MNQNWIVENLNNAFSTWNGKLTELWGLVTTSPQTFKGGAVWGVMQSLHNAMIGIGYALIVLFFAIYHLIPDYGGHKFSTSDRHACGIKSANFQKRGVLYKQQRI